MIGVQKKKALRASFPDLLNHAFVVAPGVILLKDWGLMAGWEFTGVDLTIESNAYRNSLSRALRRMFNGLGSEWSVWVNSIRTESTPYPKGVFPDPVSQSIDDERRSNYNNGATYETVHTMVLVWRPETGVKEKWIDVLLGKKRKEESSLEKRIADFQIHLDDIADQIGGHLNLYRLSEWSDSQHRSDLLLSHVRECITGDRMPLANPLFSFYVDHVMGLPDLHVGNDNLLLGEQYVSVVAIDGWPLETYPGILEEFDALPLEYRWTTRYEFLSAREAERELKRIRTRWAQETRGFIDQLMHKEPSSKSSINQDAASMVGEVDEALTTTASGSASFGKYASTFVLRHENRNVVREQARELKRWFYERGFGARIETINCAEAFLGSLPGHTKENLRKIIIDTAQLSHVIPLSSTWTGAQSCPSDKIEGGKAPPLIFAHTEQTTPFRFHLHVQDVGHSIVLGPTGSGKSTLLNLIAAQFLRYPNATVHIFDKGFSFETLTEAVGGSHYEITGVESDPVSFYPLRDIDRESEREWAVEWLEEMISLQGLKPGAEERNELADAVDHLAAAPGDRTLSSLVTTLQSMEIKESLTPYTVAGPYGKILDSTSENLKSARFVCYEVGELLNRSEKLALVVLSLLFHRVEQQARGQPMLLILDEAWVMFKHQVFSEKIREWLKTFRKLNVAVVMATQSVQEVADSSLSTDILESCFTRVYGADPDARTSSIQEQYLSMGLESREVDVISLLNPKRQYYVQQRTEGSRIVDFQLTPKALAFCGISSPEQLSRVRELRKATNQWQNTWLMECLGETHDKISETVSVD